MEYLLEIFGVINSSIYGYIFVPFAVCNLIFTALRSINKTQTLQKTIKLSERIFYTAGIVYFSIFFLNTLVVVLYFQHYDIFGIYALAYWVQPIVWFTCSQLIRFDLIKKYSIFRILISVFVLISFEYYIILGTTIARDYPNIEYIKLLKPTFIYAILFIKSFVFGFFCYAFVMRNKGLDNEHILDSEIENSKIAND